MINHEITNVVWRIAGPSILVVRYGQVVDQLTKEVPADQILIRFHSDESELAQFVKLAFFILGNGCGFRSV